MTFSGRGDSVLTGIPLPENVSSSTTGDPSDFSRQLQGKVEHEALSAIGKERGRQSPFSLVVWG
jgi:hypothetical protein